ncbi:hypothetical protein COBT_000570 [Conglomerata obtusa]
MPTADDKYPEWSEFFASITTPSNNELTFSFLTDQNDYLLNHKNTCSESEVAELKKYLNNETNIVKIGEIKFLNVRRLEKEDYITHNFVEIGDSDKKKGMIVVEFSDGFLFVGVYDECNKGNVFDYLSKFF